MAEKQQKKAPLSSVQEDKADDVQLKKTSSPSKSLFSLLVDRIKKTFQAPKTEERKLSGRVQQLHQASATVIQRLRTIKELLRGKVDSQLFSHVENLMDPMTRDLNGAQKLFSPDNSVVNQAKAFKRYSNWMIKAELWLGLEAIEWNSEAVTKTIIMHTVKEVEEQVDQDLQVIRDYEDHVLESLLVSEEDEFLLKKHISKEMRLPVSSLEELKDEVMFTSLEDAFKWKDDVDKKRSKYFDQALRVIDDVIDAISPGSSSEEEHEYLVDVLSQIVYLEDEIPGLAEEMERISSQDMMRKAVMLSKIDSFSKELHELNLNLRLTPELVDRLQVLMNSLSLISEKLDSLSE